MVIQKKEYLTGRVLIAMPGMGDPRFHHAVILICAHDKKGAMGLVINHVLPGIEFNDLLGQLKVESDIKVSFEKMKLPVMCGGPIESARGFFLHSGDFKHEDTIHVNASFGVTGTLDALKDVVSSKKPENLMFILGYAGWEAGQLENEIMQNAWLVAEPDEEIIFTPDYKNKWTQAVNKLGIDPGLLSSSAGRAQKSYTDIQQFHLRLNDKVTRIDHIFSIINVCSETQLRNSNKVITGTICID